MSLLPFWYRVLNSEPLTCWEALNPGAQSLPSAQHLEHRVHRTERLGGNTDRYSVTLAHTHTCTHTHTSLGSVYMCTYLHVPI